MRSIVVIVAVALVALVGGIAVTGLPDSVPHDVVSGEVQATSPSPATTAVIMPTTLVGEASLSVIVVDNASNPPGLADSVVQQLSNFGYTDVVATDAIAPRSESVVVYADGREGEARRLAEQLGVAATQVEPRGDGPLTVDDATGDLLALLGTDID